MDEDEHQLEFFLPFFVNHTFIKSSLDGDVYFISAHPPTITPANVVHANNCLVYPDIPFSLVPFNSTQPTHAYKIELQRLLSCKIHNFINNYLYEFQYYISYCSKQSQFSTSIYLKQFYFEYKSCSSCRNKTA